MAASGGVGSIYAEATLDVSKFLSAAGSLNAAAAQMTGALNRASLEAMGATAGFGTLGAAIPAAMAQGIAGASGAAQAAARAAASGAASAMAGAAGSASGAGARFSAGLAAGIAGGRSAVVSAAAGVAAAAVSAARAALQIHSPSRVTTGFGEAFDQGFVKGVMNLRPQVDQAVRAVVNVAPAGVAANRRAGAEIVTAASGAAVDYERLAAASASRPTVLQLNGRTLAEATSGDTARAQNSRARRVALRYGAI